MTVICYGGDLVWQFIQAMQQLPVPAREPLGWALNDTDLGAATLFGSQATGLSHETVAAIGFTAAALYTVALAAAIRWAWRRGVRAGGPELRPATGATAGVPGEPPPGRSRGAYPASGAAVRPVPEHPHYQIGLICTRRSGCAHSH